jgi:hypothetical protein
MAAHFACMGSTRENLSTFEITANIFSKAWNLMQHLMVSGALFRNHDCAWSAIRISVAATHVAMSARELLIANFITNNQISCSTGEWRLHYSLSTITGEWFSNNDATLSTVSQVMN